MIRVVGVDPGLSALAVATSPTKVSVITAPAPKSKMITDRLNRYRTQAWQAKVLCDAAGAVFIEDYAYGARGASVHRMLEAAWTLRTMLAETNFVVEVPISVVKKFVTGKGNASKLDVAVQIAKKFPKANVTSDDIADAIGLWWFGMAIVGQVEITKAQKAVVLRFCQKVDGEVAKHLRQIRKSAKVRK